MVGLFSAMVPGEQYTSIVCQLEKRPSAEEATCEVAFSWHGVRLETVQEIRLNQPQSNILGRHITSSSASVY